MSNSKKKDDEIFSPELPPQFKKNPPLPQPGYGLLFSEEQAQAISEFVATPLFKMLKRVYGLQAKDRAARQCLQGAQNVEWLMYYKGIAASADLIFKDLESTAKEYAKANDDSDPEDKKYKK